ncbi:MAG: response regulator [Candidatus Omnitrophica bacterium]|nr:response regulator [Candidatus Omnitrophota bacterium]
MPTKILIADDEKDFVIFMKDILAESGRAIDVAFDGQEALALIKKNNYDIIFADHKMPKVTGLELIKYVKEKNLRSKIVMISAYPKMEEAVAKQVGADGYLEKPVSSKVVEDMINKMLGNQAGGSAERK